MLGSGSKATTGTLESSVRPLLLIPVQIGVRRRSLGHRLLPFLSLFFLLVPQLNFFWIGCHIVFLLKRSTTFIQINLGQLSGAKSEQRPDGRDWVRGFGSVQR